MFKGPQGMSLAGNAAASAVAAATTAAASAADAAAAASTAATFAATFAAVDKTKIFASSLILPGGLPNGSACYQARK